MIYDPLYFKPSGLDVAYTSEPLRWFDEIEDEFSGTGENVHSVRKNNSSEREAS